MKNIQIRTVNEKTGQPLYTENLNNVIVFLKHSEDKIIISSKEQVEIEIQDNGETIFLGTKTELFKLLRGGKEELEQRLEKDFLADAINKVTEELFNTIEPGEEKTLNEKYHLYRYLEDDIISIYETETEEEVIQVLENGKGKFEFESLI